jgi:putative serine/threonine protein kinase
VSQNFLLMEFIDGDLLPCWIEKSEEPEALRNVLRKIIVQCAKLDSISLDHGELSKAPKHIIIDALQEPYIVDFETASLRRRPSNVSAICQYLFSSRGAVAQLISERIGPRDIDNIIDTLRIYKHSLTQEGLTEVLNACLS